MAQVLFHNFSEKEPPSNQCYCIILYVMPMVYFENLNTLPTQAKCRTEKYIDYQEEIYTLASLYGAIYTES